jgi:anti-sigma factor RsiW
MTTQQAQERGEIEELLPWHAAGTLSRRDARRVEDALAADPELQRRFELVREEMGETILLNESLGAPSRRAMDKLFAQIEAESGPAKAVTPSLATRVSEFFASLTPRTLAWSAAAAALIVLLQAGIITDVAMKDHASGYVTASAPPTAAVEGSYAMIQFAPQASAADITHFLAENKLAIVDGPNAGTGMFKVRVAVTALPKEELAKIVKRLQEDKTVGFIATAN